MQREIPQYVGFRGTLVIQGEPKQKPKPLKQIKLHQDKMLFIWGAEPVVLKTYSWLCIRDYTYGAWGTIWGAKD